MIIWLLLNSKLLEIDGLPIFTLQDMMVGNGLMPFIIECDECRATDKEFIEVCGICYEETCKTMTKPVFICQDHEPYIDIIDPGESLLT